MLLPAVVVAQGENGASLTVQSSPPGAQIILKGDAVVTGVAPTTFRYPLFGDYEVILKKRGYESYKTRVVLDPSRLMQLDVELTRKTAVRAAVRSIFFPGWGQYYTERKTKGIVFDVLFAGALVSYLIADHNFNIKEERYLRRLAEYDRAVGAGESHEQLSHRLTALTEAQKAAYDGEDIRRAAGGAMAGIWGLSILDALLLTQKEKASVTVEGLTLAPSGDFHGIGFTLTGSF